MRIAIVTFWYNEEELAPFFLKHYSYVDDIFVYLDIDTNDGTRSICEAHSNVTIRDMSFPEGYDPMTHTSKINSVVKGLKHDWVYVVDGDEFIQQPKQYEDAKEFLLKQEQAGYTLVIARMFQVFRHFTDEDLDISKPVLAQRCHGDPNLKTMFNRCYIKPIVVKPETGVSWRPGCHVYCGNRNIRVAKEQFFGAHWKMADDSFVIKRRLHNIQARLSQRSLKLRMSYQDIGITEESILGDLEKHRHNPDVLSSLLPTKDKLGFRRLEDLRDKYEGKEIWVLGRGPSLDDYPPSFFVEKISIAVNYAFLAFPNCTYYHSFHADVAEWVVENWPDKFSKCILGCLWGSSHGDRQRRNVYEGSGEVPIYAKVIWSTGPLDTSRYRGVVECNIAKESCDLIDGITTLHTAIQVAIVLGAKRVTLVGCDLKMRKGLIHARRTWLSESHEKAYLNRWRRWVETRFFPGSRKSLLWLVELCKPHGIEVVRYNYGEGYEQIKAQS